ncbi:MAG: glycosyltransferase [Planctomyces sp.]|nr:glycosyltransferase [Planctomyces sp.]
MIRIAFVIPTLDQSGAERQLMMLATRLPKDRFQAKVFALNRGGFYADAIQAAGVEVEVLQKQFRFDPLTYIRLKGRLSHFRPQIVQSWLFAANSYVRFPGVCPAGTRVIISERCVDSWKSRWQLILDRWLSQRMLLMTANSRSVAAFYEKAGVPSGRIAVIPNGIDVPQEAVDKSALRQEFGIRSDERVLGFVGRLAPQKRLKDLIWAFQLLHQAVDNTRLVIIGDGPERQTLVQLAQHFGCYDKIVFTGHRSDAYKLMQGLDVFCLASEFEGMSNSLMEAMSLGIPVIASGIDANRELVQHEQTGLIFATGSSPEIAKSAKRLFENPELAKKLGQAGREWIRQHHSIDRMVQAHVALYDRFLLKDSSLCAG